MWRPGWFLMCFSWFVGSQKPFWILSVIKRKNKQKRWSLRLCGFSFWPIAICAIFAGGLWCLIGRIQGHDDVGLSRRFSLALLRICSGHQKTPGKTEPNLSSTTVIVGSSIHKSKKKKKKKKKKNTWNTQNTCQFPTPKVYSVYIYHNAFVDVPLITFQPLLPGPEKHQLASGVYRLAFQDLTVNPSKANGKLLKRCYLEFCKHWMIYLARVL